jgi:2-keto-4-pentenoate hydratase/2-oxohepta-3-ene-1,7-dioic acid hydratase in catechol pathway
MHEERAIRLLPPVPDPDRFLCAAADDPATDLPASTRLPASLIGHDAKVARPRSAARLDCVSVLVFVVGRRGLGVKEADAMDHVAGITLLNDLRVARLRPARAGDRHDGRAPRSPRPLGHLLRERR